MKYKEAVKTFVSLYWDDSHLYDDEYYTAYCGGTQYGVVNVLALTYGKDTRKVRKDLDKATEKWLKNR